MTQVRGRALERVFNKFSIPPAIAGVGAGVGARVATVAALLLLAVAAACGGPDEGESIDDATSAQPLDAADGEGSGPVTTVAATTTQASADEDEDAVEDAGPATGLLVGAEVLAADDFSLLAGRRVGVVLNQASTVGSGTLLEAMTASDNVDLVALFGPEHGILGNLPAGVPVSDTIDPLSGAPVFSLYGDTKRPTPESLANVDVLVFDLQDVGARVYTYISTMGLAMQAAAEAGIPFVVLDRPNPLGGNYVDGYVRDDANESFVGQYPIPTAHGMTIGELAGAIKGEAWLPGLESLDLQVVEMKGWTRSQTWLDLDRNWVAPSPSLPDSTTAGIYPGTVLFEATNLSVGRGTESPFAAVGGPGVRSHELWEPLNALGLPGVVFEPVVFTPEPSEAVPSPKLEGQAVEAVRVIPQDETFRPVEVGVHLVAAMYADAKEQGAATFFDNPQLLDLLAGTGQLRSAITSGESATQIIDGWAADLAAFDELRRPYLLYD